MEHLAQGILKMGLLDAHGQQEEFAQFQGMMKRFAEIMSQQLGVEQVSRHIVRIIIEETNFGNCSIVLWDQTRQGLFLSAAFGLENLLGREPRRPFNKSLFFASGEGIAGQVLSTQKPVYVEDSTVEPLPRKVGAIVQPLSLICLPLMDFGVLNISSQYPNPFPPHLRKNWEAANKIVSYLVLQATLHDKPHEACSHAPRGRMENIMAQPAESSCPAAPVHLSEHVIDHTPQGICVLDHAGSVVKINRSLMKLHGEGVSGVVGRSPSVFFHDPQVFKKLFEKVEATDHADIADVSLVNPAGELYLADVHLARMSDDCGGIMGYLLVINDMTKRKAFAEKILRTEKLAALGTMAGGVAHDFNNLLMAILGNIQMIMHQSTDEEMQRRLQNIEKAVHDGAHTVRRLQKFTERDKGQNTTPTAVDITEAIKDVVELTRPRWKNAMEKFGHTVQFEMDLDPGCVAAIHASDLREVLTNLVFNAIEAMPEGGILTLRSRNAKEWNVIEIADTGIGMSEEVSRRIFDPFYTTKGVGNSGLGLSVSWSLVSRCGGEVQVKSKPGKGTTFILKLPKAAAPLRIVDSSAVTRGDISRRLLVVDDDLEVLSILRDMLRLKGHRVVATDDGERALDLISNETFDLVLTDLGMPVVSGWDIARSAKMRNRDIPVILITGWGAQYEEEDLSKHGIDSVLSKPLSWEKLLGTVEKILASPNTRQISG
jgi:PAS domain S-box-containing protein